MWHALYTRSGKEAAVADAVKARGLRSFCPMIVSEERVRAKRGLSQFVIAEVERPAFSRYLFVRIGKRLYDAMRSLPPNLGSVSFVSMGGEPVPVRDEVVEALRVAVEEEEVKQVALKVGDRVMVDSLLGLVAVVSSINDLVKSQAVSVWVNMFGSKRELSVSVDSISEVLRTS